MIIKHKIVVGMMILDTVETPCGLPTVQICVRVTVRNARSFSHPHSHSARSSFLVFLRFCFAFIAAVDDDNIPFVNHCILHIIRFLKSVRIDGNCLGGHHRCLMEEIHRVVPTKIRGAVRKIVNSKID